MLLQLFSQPDSHEFSLFLWKASIEAKYGQLYSSVWRLSIVHCYWPGNMNCILVVPLFPSSANVRCRYGNLGASSTNDRMSCPVYHFWSLILGSPKYSNILDHHHNGSVIIHWSLRVTGFGSESFSILSSTSKRGLSILAFSNTIPMIDLVCLLLLLVKLAAR